jgi:hypothetical protein
MEQNVGLRERVNTKTPLVTHLLEKEGQVVILEELSFKTIINSILFQ